MRRRAVEPFILRRQIRTLESAQPESAPAGLRADRSDNLACVIDSPNSPTLNLIQRSEIDYDVGILRKGGLQHAEEAHNSEEALKMPDEVRTRHRCLRPDFQGCWRLRLSWAQIQADYPSREANAVQGSAFPCIHMQRCEVGAGPFVAVRRM